MYNLDFICSYTRFTLITLTKSYVNLGFQDEVIPKVAEYEARTYGIPYDNYTMSLGNFLLININKRMIFECNNILNPL